VNIFQDTQLINFLGGVAIGLSLYYSVEALGVICIVYPYCFFPSNKGSAFYNPLHIVFVHTVELSGAINCLIVITFLLLEKAGEIHIFLLIIGSLVLSYVISVFFVKWRQSRQIALLDEIRDNSDVELEVTNMDTFKSMTIAIFLFNHMQCLSFEIFSSGLKNFPDSESFLTV
jgi:hypothetical protein